MKMSVCGIGRAPENQKEMTVVMVADGDGLIYSGNGAVYIS